MKILLLADGGPPSLQAARLLAAWRGDVAQLQPVLLNVQRPLVHAWPTGIDPALLERGQQDEGMAELEAARAVLAGRGWAPECRVVIGAPAETILQVAAEVQPALLVMGTRGHSLLAGLALGSVALRVAPGAAAPVVLVHADSRLPARWGEELRVTLPIDGSEAAVSAVRRLLALRPLLGTLQVDLVHFQPALTLLGAILPPHDDVVERWGGADAAPVVDAARRLLEEAAVAHEVHRIGGDPALGIARFASERQAGLIAMATHGTGSIRHAFGSVALKTAQLSEVPVALLR
jgi:nucleotide-binding universal stress UspA family protein